MKNSEFSEKFYEILIDNMLLNHGYQIYVPSPRKEYKRGFDALITNIKNISKSKRIKAIALQFKISSEYSKPPFIAENFKFDLHHAHHFHQHNQLCKYNKIRKFLAAYCAPQFVTFHDLFNYFNSGTLLLNSSAIIPTCNICDNDYHYITFGNSSAHLHSKESTYCKIHNLTQLLEKCDTELMNPKEFIEILESISTEFDKFEMKQKNRNKLVNSFSIIYKIVDNPKR